jgi:hypothetical protein
MTDYSPTVQKGSAPGPMADSTYAPATDGPREAAPAPGINTEDGPPRVVIPYVQHKLRDETQAVGEAMGATFVDVTGEATAYFTVMTRQWESGHGFLLLEEDVAPTPEILVEMWSCPAEWCSAFFWAWDGAVMDGESRPRRPTRHKVAGTLALNKFGTSLLGRAPGAMQDAAARTNDVRHFNQLDLALVNSGGVLQGHPYHAVPHIHGPVDHRTPPAWVPLIVDTDWVDA